MLKEWAKMVLGCSALGIYGFSAIYTTVNDNILIGIIGIFVLAALVAMRSTTLDPQYHSRLEILREQVVVMFLFIIPVVPGVVTVATIELAGGKKINKDVVLLNIAGLLNLVASWLLIARFVNLPM